MLTLLLWGLSFGGEVAHVCNGNTDTCDRRSNAMKCGGGSSDLSRKGRELDKIVWRGRHLI